MNYLKHICAMLVLPAVAACSGEADEPVPAGPKQTAISFSHSVVAAEEDGASSSRAAVTEKEDMLSFCVYGALYENWHIFKGYLISGDRVIPAKKDDSWVTENLYYWPDQTMGMSFFAYSPENVEGLQLLNADEGPTNPRFSYEPPTDPKKQVDLMFANTNPYAPINYGSEPGKRVPLTFRHRLIQVYFEVRGDASKVASITLKNVFRKGVFNFQGNQWWDIPRDDVDSKTSYTIEAPADGIFGDDQRLMIIPQVTPHDCTLEIAFRDGSPLRSVPFGGKFDPNHIGGKVYRVIINT